MDLFLSKITNQALDVLRVNGFKDAKDEDDVQGYYYYLKNDICEVYVRGEDKPELTDDSYYYEVIFKYNGEYVTTYSTNLNIHWLIGFLTYNVLMRRDYILP